ncbi:hypothetical protein M3Y96_00672500 [Aphelenchoides besseyi]|nr:hypothetical protein M3Y96_00672500 [Aphelenchoides besseyi]
MNFLATLLVLFVGIAVVNAQFGMNPMFNPMMMNRFGMSPYSMLGGSPFSGFGSYQMNPYMMGKK